MHPECPLATTDYSFDVQTARGEKGGYAKNKHTEEMPNASAGKPF